MRKSEVIIAFALMLSFITFAQTNKNLKSTCFESVHIEPGFIAFSTSKNSQLGKWYQDVFGLEVVKEFAFPDGSVNGVLMKRNEFVVELFYRDNILERKTFKPESKTEQWKGVMKVGVYTNANLPKLKKCLKNRGLKAGRIFNDTTLNIDLLHVTDPEGNAIEIISRIAE